MATCKKLLWLFLLAFISFQASSSSIEINGNIETSTTWDTDTVIISYCEVAKKVSVTVNDGVTVLAKKDATIELLWGSSMNFRGSAKGITIKCMTEGEFWGGFRFLEDHAELTLTNTAISDAVKAIVAGKDLDYFNLTMDSCQVLNSEETPLTVSSRGYYDAYSEISNCLFSGGKRGPSINRSEFLVTNCVIENFTFSGGVNVGSASGAFVNCLIRNNNSYARGGGIYVSGKGSWGAVKIYNCTIVNNNAEDDGGGYADSGAEVNMLNSIVWNNTSFGNHQNYLGYQPAIHYCTIDEHLLKPDSRGLIREDPLFVDARNGDFRLSPGSPAINAGRYSTVGLSLPDFDLDGNTRIIGDTIDMGVYEAAEIMVGTRSSSVKNTASLRLYPNPTSGFFTVAAEWNAGGDLLHCSVYSFDGKAVFESPMNDQIGIEISDWPVGIYRVVVRDESGHSSSKNLVVR